MATTGSDKTQKKRKPNAGMVKSNLNYFSKFELIIPSVVQL